MNKHGKKGSLKHNTEIMTEIEADLFIKSAAEAAINELPIDKELTEENVKEIISEAKEDMKMIDSILHMKRLHLVVHGHIKYTSRGNLRKGTSVYNSMESIINARVNGAFRDTN